jgi:hypothetical protein
MARPIIFLDFDGVLNSHRSRVATGRGALLCFDPISVLLVQKLALQAHAHVVISSAWREGATLIRLREILTQVGGSDLALLVIGKTGRLPSCRGAEIADWMADHPSRHNGSYVILDDEADVLEVQRPHLVQCSFRDGFGLVEYVRALEIIAPQHEHVTQLAYAARQQGKPAPMLPHLEWDA